MPGARSCTGVALLTVALLACCWSSKRRGKVPARGCAEIPFQNDDVHTAILGSSSQRSIGCDGMEFRKASSGEPAWCETVAHDQQSDHFCGARGGKLPIRGV